MFSFSSFSPLFPSLSPSGPEEGFPLALKNPTIPKFPEVFYANDRTARIPDRPCDDLRAR